MDLVLLRDAAVALEQVANVIQGLTLDGELRSADDIDVVLDGKLGKHLKILGSELSQLSR